MARLSYHCHIKARHAETDGGETMRKLVHGYINATGVFPQAEDVIDEMGAFILEKLGYLATDLYAPSKPDPATPAPSSTQQRNTL